MRNSFFFAQVIYLYKDFHLVYPSLIISCRIIFSAHTHKFCDRTHYDGTREITVPAMSWEAIDDPGFVVASFKSDRKSVTVSHCLLAKESSVIFTCTSILVLTILSLLVTQSPSQTNSAS